MSDLIDLAPNVGGVIHLVYAAPGLAMEYNIHLAVAPFDPTPSGSDQDYLYVGGAGAVDPVESGIIATVGNLGLVWRPYYPDIWVLQLARVYQNVGGFPQLLPVVPHAANETGTAPPSSSGDAVVKRTLSMFSAVGSRWRTWLRRMPGETVGMHVDVGTTTGGIDSRDRDWYAYISSNLTGIIARDGTRFQPGGRVFQWWDSPLVLFPPETEPYLVSG